MTARTLADLPDWPRLLTRRQAADYCQLTPEQFEAACPVAPLRLQRKVSPQSRRWDRTAIDAWLDSLAGGGKAARTRQHWVKAIDAGDDETASRPAH